MGAHHEIESHLSDSKYNKKPSHIDVKQNNLGFLGRQVERSVDRKVTNRKHISSVLNDVKTLKNMKGKVSASNLPISSDIIKRQEEKLKQDRANLDADFQSEDMRNFMQKDEKSV